MDRLISMKVCINTSTIRGRGLSLPVLASLVARAGWQGIEPWIAELEAVDKQPGGLEQLAQQLSDLGLEMPSAIGFSQWIVDDPAQRRAGLEDARRCMRLVRRAGGKRIAAASIGAHTQESRVIPNDVIAERFAALAAIGREEGIEPELELWGFSTNLKRLDTVKQVYRMAGAAGSTMLLDIYHLYKGESDLKGLSDIRASELGVFHVNDYPEMPAALIADKDRVYPQNGIAPGRQIIRQLKKSGWNGFISLELFNPEYDQLPVELVIRTGLEKTRELLNAK